MTLREKIYYCRKKAGYSQEEMADKLGVSRQAVSKWETGEAVPELAKFTAIAKLFGVTTDWLLSEDDSEPWGEAANSNERPDDPSGTVINADTISDGFVGIIEKMWRKYGWLIGVVLSVGGAAFIGVSLMGYLMFEQTGKAAEESFNSFFGEVGLYPPGFTDDMSSFIARNPSTPITVGGAVFGAVLLIGGIVLVIMHRKKYGKK